MADKTDDELYNEYYNKALKDLSEQNRYIYPGKYDPELVEQKAKTTKPETTIQPYDEATEKRKEADKYASKKGTKYGNAKVQEMITGESTPTTIWGDAGIDIVSMLLLATAGGALGKAIENSKAYKGAKLRETANLTDYKFTTPSIMMDLEGSVDSPTGQMGRIIRKLYGGEKNFKKTQKATQKIYETYGLKAVEILMTDYKLSPAEAKAKYDALTMQKLLTGKVESENMKDVAKIIDTMIEKIKDIRIAKKVLNNNVKFNGKSVIIPKTDKAILKAPETIASAAGTTGLVSAGRTLLDAANKTKELPFPTRDPGAISPTTIPTLSELLLEYGITYSKSEMAREISKHYDKIISEGTYSQRKQARQIMENINYGNKKQMAESLVDLIQLSLTE